jgi:hypothetical protein
MDGNTPAYTEEALDSFDDDMKRLGSRMATARVKAVVAAESEVANRKEQPLLIAKDLCKNLAAAREEWAVAKQTHSDLEHFFDLYFENVTEPNEIETNAKKSLVLYKIVERVLNTSLLQAQRLKGAIELSDRPDEVFEKPVPLACTAQRQQAAEVSSRPRVGGAS